MGPNLGVKHKGEGCPHPTEDDDCPEPIERVMQTSVVISYNFKVGDPIFLIGITNEGHCVVWQEGKAKPMVC